MVQDFSELVSYLDKRFTALDSAMESKAEKGDVRQLTVAIDAYAHKADTYFQEMAMLAHKVDRLERQIHTIAKKTGVSLEDM